VLRPRHPHTRVGTAYVREVPPLGGLVRHGGRGTLDPLGGDPATRGRGAQVRRDALRLRRRVDQPVDTGGGGVVVARSGADAVGAAAWLSLWALAVALLWWRVAAPMSEARRTAPNP